MRRRKEGDERAMRPNRALHALVVVVATLLAGTCAERSAAAAATDPWSAFVVPTFHTFDQEDGLPHDARRLRLALRLSDRIARLGGDEFAILLDDLPGTFASDREGVASICERVLGSFETPISLDGEAVRATPSIGVALAPEHAEKPAGLYKAADVALYRSKREGRNTWRLHEPSDEASPDAVPAHVVSA